MGSRKGGVMKKSIALVAALAATCAFASTASAQERTVTPIARGQIVPSESLSSMTIAYECLAVAQGDATETSIDRCYIRNKDTGAYYARTSATMPGPFAFTAKTATLPAAGHYQVCVVASATWSDDTRYTTPITCAAELP